MTKLTVVSIEALTTTVQDYCQQLRKERTQQLLSIDRIQSLQLTVPRCSLCLAAVGSLFVHYCWHYS